MPRENGHGKGSTTQDSPTGTSREVNSPRSSKQQGQHQTTTPAALAFQPTFDDRSTTGEVSNSPSAYLGDPSSVEEDRLPIQLLSLPDHGDAPQTGQPGIEQPQQLCCHQGRDNGIAAIGTEDKPLSTLMVTRNQQHMHEAPSQISALSDPYPGCRYSCLRPILPHLQNIISPSLACDLLDVYFTEPGNSFFSSPSSYVLTPIIRKKSLLHPTHPRPTTLTLLSAMLWCSAQTADFVSLRLPGARFKAVNALYDLTTSLLAERDPDNWRRTQGLSPTTRGVYYNFLRGLLGDFQLENVSSQDSRSYSSVPHSTTATNEPSGTVDDVLTFALLAIAVSGGEFKSDSLKWWSRAVRLAFTLGLNTEDEPCSAVVSQSNLLSNSRKWPGIDSLPEFEAKEERRRVFWMLYCLDRHLALSHNAPLRIPDPYCDVFGKLKLSQAAHGKN